MAFRFAQDIYPLKEHSTFYAHPRNAVQYAAQRGQQRGLTRARPTYDGRYAVGGHRQAHPVEGQKAPIPDTQAVGDKCIALVLTGSDICGRWIPFDSWGILLCYLSNS
jgi:hypothetical protein